jgi:hypothetical protein
LSKRAQRFGNVGHFADNRIHSLHNCMLPFDMGDSCFYNTHIHRYNCRHMEICYVGICFASCRSIVLSRSYISLGNPHSRSYSYSLNYNTTCPLCTEDNCSICYSQHGKLKRTTIVYENFRYIIN